MGFLSFYMKNWYLYKIINNNGEVYIGCTQNLERRVRQYKQMGDTLKKQKRLYESLLKYGFEQHDIQVIENFQGDQLEAESKEIFWIRTYMSNYNKWPEVNGLNLTDGGKGAFGHKGLIGIKRSKEFRDKLSEIKKDVKLSEYHKRRLSESHLGQINSNRRAICMVDNKGKVLFEYESIAKAANELKCSSSCIARVLKQTYSDYKGMIFKYK